MMHPFTWPLVRAARREPLEWADAQAHRSHLNKAGVAFTQAQRGAQCLELGKHLPMCLLAQQAQQQNDASQDCRDLNSYQNCGPIFLVRA